MGLIVYFSSRSENTHRFVGKLGLPSSRIPVSPRDGDPTVREPFVLIVPTYSGEGGKGPFPNRSSAFSTMRATALISVA